MGSCAESDVLVRDPRRRPSNWEAPVAVSVYGLSFRVSGSRITDFYLALLLQLPHRGRPRRRWLLALLLLHLLLIITIAATTTKTTAPSSCSPCFLACLLSPLVAYKALTKLENAQHSGTQRLSKDGSRGGSRFRVQDNLHQLVPIIP